MNTAGTDDSATSGTSIPASRLGPDLWGFVQRLAILAVFVAAAVLLWYGLEVLLLAFAGLLLAILLTTLASWTSRYTHLSHGWSLALVVVLLLGLAALLGWLLASQIGSDIEQLSQQLPQSVERLREDLSQTTWGHAILRETSFPETEAAQQRFFGRLGGALTLTADALAGLLVILFVGLYGAVEPGLYWKGTLSLVPPAHRERMSSALDAVIKTLRWWLFGQLLVMLVTGSLVGLGLWLVGMPLPFALALIAFLLEVIPVIGPFLFAIPGLLLALTVSPNEALYALIVYMVVQGIESNLLIPLVQRQTVRLPPVLTILVVTLAWVASGPLGLLLATPLMAAALVLVKRLYVQDTLGGPAGSQGKAA